MIKNLKQNLKGKDKLLHSLIGNLIFLGTFIVSAIVTDKVLLSILVATIVLLIASFSKELYDKFIKRTFIDWYDIVAAFTPYFIVEKINKNE